MNFNPEKYNFTRIPSGKFTYVWKPPQHYVISFDSENEIWTIREDRTFENYIYTHLLYEGPIPDEIFGHNLLLSLRLNIPIINRELKIDEIL